MENSFQVSLSDYFGALETTAGADCSYFQGKVIAVIVVQDAYNLDILEIKHIIQSVKMPYISTYLSFREGYPLSCTFKDLRIKPDLMLVDGCGISHPRGVELHHILELYGHTYHWNFKKDPLRESLRTDSQR
jgi:deoxyribonuclease V